jgi:CBS domain-containing protein
MTKVYEIMTKNPAYCTMETGLVDAAQLMLKNDCGEIPVVYSTHNKKIVGVITDRDICLRAVAVGLNPLSMHVGQCISYPPIMVRDIANLEDACEIMEQHQIRRLPVVDEDENCCGMISLSDITKVHKEKLAAEVLTKVSESSSSANFH